MFTIIDESGSDKDTVFLEVAFDEVENIAIFLNSIKNADDRTAMLRMNELKAMKMTTANWNVMSIAARVVLFQHPIYQQVIEVIQEKSEI